MSTGESRVNFVSNIGGGIITCLNGVNKTEPEEIEIKKNLYQ